MMYMMHAIRAVCLVSLCGLLFANGARAENLSHASTRLREIVKTADALPMPAWALPAIRKTQINPSVSVWTLEDHTLPTVEIVLQFPYGSLDDDDRHIGRAALMAKAWRMGGAGEYTPQAFAQALETRAISLSVDVGLELTTVSLACLEKDVSFALALLETWLTAPRFDVAQFELVKRQGEAAFLSLADEDDQVAAYLYPNWVYGDQTPMGRRSTPTRLRALTHDDVKQAYRALLQSGPLWVGAAGDIRKTEMVAFGRKVFAQMSLPLRESRVFQQIEEKWPIGKKIDQSPDESSRVLFVTKPGEQSTIVMGHLGDRRDNADKYALFLANHILGGDTLNGLLGKELRVSRGLVYGVRSDFGFERDYGLFRIVLKTKAKATETVLSVAQAELRAFINGEGVTEAALMNAKRVYLSSLLFSNEEKGTLLKTLMRFAYYGYPPDYLERFGQEIEAVTLADIQRVAKHYLKPEHMQVVVVGPLTAVPKAGPFRPTRVLPIAKIFE